MVLLRLIEALHHRWIPLEEEAVIIITAVVVVAAAAVIDGVGLLAADLTVAEEEEGTRTIAVEEARTVEDGGKGTARLVVTDGAAVADGEDKWLLMTMAHGLPF